LGGNQTDSRRKVIAPFLILFFLPYFILFVSFT
jgi:hypothetical protein